MTQMPINSPSLPGIRQPLLEGTSASRPYYLFLQWVATNLSSLSATVADLSAQQGGISISPDANVTGQNSIKTRGTLAEGIVQVSLQGDVSVAGNTQYYGSDQTGNKGWYAVSSALAGSSNISLSTAANGVTTFDLADVADSGAGSLLAITRDSKGRITGTRAATITGTANQIDVANGDGSAGPPTLSLDAAVLNQLAELVGSPGLGYIDGLKMVWNSATSLSVTSGAAYIPLLGHVLQSPATLTLSSLVLAASTWYHVYLYNNAGTPAIECVTTAPAATYNGTARTKTGDTSRRYLGSLLTDASGNINNFLQNGDLMMYESSIANAPFLLISTGRATTVTNISCAGVVPATARVAVIIMATLNSTADAAIGNSSMSGTLSATVFLQYVGNGVQTTHLMPLDSSQRFSYVMTATTTTGGFFARVCGYVLER